MWVSFVLFTHQLEQEAGTESTHQLLSALQSIGALLWATKNDWGLPLHVTGKVEEAEAFLTEPATA